MFEKKKIERSGLCVIDKESERMVVLIRECPYKAREIVPSKNPIFVEQYSLPRGKCQERNENLQQCALREFIEETRVFFVDVKFSKSYFNLYWCDPPNVKWEYRIYFAFASLKEENLIHVNQNYKIDNMNTIHIRKKDLKYEPMKPAFLNILNYTFLVRERLHLYGDNNYLEFIEHLTNFQLKCDRRSEIISLPSFMFYTHLKF